MKSSLQSQWLVVPVLLFSTSLCLAQVWRLENERRWEREQRLEHNRRVEHKHQLENERMRPRLIGTWDVLQEKGDKEANFKWYWKFNRDGKGEQIFEGRNNRQDAPFTYVLMNSRLEITCDWTYCGNNVVPLDDPCIPNDVYQDRVISFPVYFGANRNCIYLTPDMFDATRGTTYWQRVVLKPFPQEVDR